MRNAKVNKLIRQFVPAPIAEELENAVVAHTRLNYYSEIREVTTMFMKVRFFLRLVCLVWCDSLSFSGSAYHPRIIIL